MALLFTVGYLILMLCVVAIVVKIPFFIFQAVYWIVVKRYSHLSLVINDVLIPNILIRSLVFGVFFTSSSFLSSYLRSLQILVPLIFVIPALAGVCVDVYMQNKKQGTTPLSFLIASIIINVLSSCYTLFLADAAGQSCMGAGGC